jgi:hypothetical protein
VKPATLTTAEVRAVLAGPAEYVRAICLRGHWTVDERDDGALWPFDCTWTPGEEGDGWIRCPYGQPGDRLWARETWKIADWTDDGMPFVEYAADGQSRCIENAPDSCALMHTWAELSSASNVAIDGKAADRRWRSPVTMPRWASRLEPLITGIRVEKREGVWCWVVDWREA